MGVGIHSILESALKYKALVLIYEEGRFCPHQNKSSTKFGGRNCTENNICALHFPRQHTELAFKEEKKFWQVSEYIMGSIPETILF